MTIKHGVPFRPIPRGNPRQVSKALSADVVKSHNDGKRYDAAKDFRCRANDDDVAEWRAQQTARSGHSGAQ
jgi:hypothetical protein